MSVATDMARATTSLTGCWWLQCFCRHCEDLESIEGDEAILVNFAFDSEMQAQCKHPQVECTRALRP